MQIPPFTPGLKLCRDYYNQTIKPLLEKKHPALPYCAALIGYGSDVLEVDNATSMDHNWGPRCIIFLRENNIHLKTALHDYLSLNLPVSFSGFPTNYSDPAYDGTQKMQFVAAPPVRHLIEICTVKDYCVDYIKHHDLENITPRDWLTFTDQNLLELTAGEVFHDGLNTLIPLRSQLRFYPPDIKKLKLAALWNCVFNEEAFIGRSIELGDPIGLKMTASRITNMLLKICFYIDEKYIPYSKWFGTFLKRLSFADELLPKAQAVLFENDPAAIEANLCTLYETVVELNNRSDSLPHLDNRITTFFNRPYKVIFAETIVETLLTALTDQTLKDIDLTTIISP